MNWDILMLFQFKCLKFIFFVKSSRIQGGEHAIRQIRFAWPKIFPDQNFFDQFSFDQQLSLILFWPKISLTSNCFAAKDSC